MHIALLIGRTREQFHSFASIVVELRDCSHLIVPSSPTGAKANAENYHFPFFCFAAD
jgi:hypothetical protein